MKNLTEQRLSGKTKQLLKQHHITLKKSLGQNFLTDPGVLERIVQSLELQKHDAVLEIGPGIGALTRPLAEQAGRVVAVEIDQRLVPVLKAEFDQFYHVSIVHNDILKADLSALFNEYFSGYERVHVAANLPYYITTPIIMQLLESQIPFHRFVLMIQKEVADRLAAKPGGKDYGSLSVAVQFYCEVEKLFTVPHSVFIPQPKVDSSVIRMERRKEPPVELLDESFFFTVVKAAFAQRRKTLYNNLSARFFSKDSKHRLIDVLDRIDIDPSCRGETLSMVQFARLSNALVQELES